MRHFLAAILLALTLFPSPALAANGDFVRTANYYLLSGSALESKDALAALASFDLIEIVRSSNRPFQVTEDLAGIGAAGTQ